MIENIYSQYIKPSNIWSPVFHAVFWSLWTFKIGAKRTIIDMWVMWTFLEIKKERWSYPNRVQQKKLFVKFLLSTRDDTSFSPCLTFPFRLNLASESDFFLWTWFHSHQNATCWLPYAAGRSSHNMTQVFGKTSTWRITMLENIHCLLSYNLTSRYQS